MADVKRAYEAKTYPHLKGLKGISDQVLESHFALYQGYVKNTNLLTEQLQAIAKEGKAAGSNLAYAEMTRRLGFEYNGMILHEYYFGNLTPAGGDLDKTSKLGSDDHASRSARSRPGCPTSKPSLRCGESAGRSCSRIPTTKFLSNHWVTLHNDGNPAGYTPILVMDAWEHAFVPDYKPTERAKYVEAYFQNIDWKAAESRLK